MNIYDECLKNVFKLYKEMKITHGELMVQIANITMASRLKLIPTGKYEEKKEDQKRTS